MITIGDILRPGSIELGLKMANREEAIYEVASLLREDERVTDWNTFYTGLTSKDPCVAVTEETRICIPHTRTNAVSSMVMSVGRSDAGIEEGGNAGGALHFIFVIGVPVAMAADYLRIIGALARIFKNPKTEKRLREAPRPDEFLRILASAEMKF